MPSPSSNAALESMLMLVACALIVAGIATAFF
jgi:hypothetical protein